MCFSYYLGPHTNSEMAADSYTPGICQVFWKKCHVKEADEDEWALW